MGCRRMSEWAKGERVEAFGVVGGEGPTEHRKTFVLDAEGVVRAIVDDERDMEAHPVGALVAVQELAGG